MIRHPKYNRGNLYLSGGMQYAKDLGAAWRVAAAAKLKGLKYFPLDICELDRMYAAKHGELFYSLDENSTQEDLVQFKSNLRKHFIFTDLELVAKDSDGIIVLWDDSAQLGGGTHNEISHAFERDIPILMVVETSIENVPGWIVSQTSRMFSSFDELWQYLEDLPYGILCRDIYGNHSSGNKYLCSLCGSDFEKQKHHFVSKVSPLYCGECVDRVAHTYEGHKNRYEFFVEYIEQVAINEITRERNE